MSEPKFPPRTLLVDIADPAPVVVLNEPVAHRFVEIELTNEQMRQLKLKRTGSSRGDGIYEFVAFVRFKYVDGVQLKNPTDTTERN